MISNYIDFDDLPEDSILLLPDDTDLEDHSADILPVPDDPDPEYAVRFLDDLPDNTNCETDGEPVVDLTCDDGEPVDDLTGGDGEPDYGYEGDGDGEPTYEHEYEPDGAEAGYEPDGAEAGYEPDGAEAGYGPDGAEAGYGPDDYDPEADGDDLDYEPVPQQTSTQGIDDQQLYDLRNYVLLTCSKLFFFLQIRLCAHTAVFSGQPQRQWRSTSVPIKAIMFALCVVWFFPAIGP